jgi:hypothetical protein
LYSAVSWNTSCRSVKEELTSHHTRMVTPTRRCSNDSSYCTLIGRVRSCSSCDMSEAPAWVSFTMTALRALPIPLTVPVPTAPSTNSASAVPPVVSPATATATLPPSRNGTGVTSTSSLGSSTSEPKTIERSLDRIRWSFSSGMPSSTVNVMIPPPTSSVPAGSIRSSSWR